MLGRFARDESGMVMGLTVIMVLLIGVMGAGLLTFVMRDLQAVVEVNRGQRALDIAEAGVQAAKSHLRVDSFREHYDTTRANDCDDGIRVGGENWSRATDIYTDPNGYCAGLGTRSDIAGTPWREDQGVSKTFAGGRFHVTIECFDQSGDPSSPDPCNGGAGSAPDVSGANLPASEKKFFKITSTGYDTTAGDGAVRKVEAIYTTAKRTYAPIAFWTPRDISFDGTKCVSRMSFFAGRNVTGVKGGTSACGPNNFIADRGATGGTAIYGHWQNGYNPTMRVDASNAPITKVGFGALGLVCGGSTCSADSDSVADGYNDYDRTTGSKGQNKRFVATSTDPASQITFPFDEGNALADPSSLVDAGLLEEMRAAAAEQGYYVSTTGTHTINTWPAQGVTYFVDGADVVFKVSSTPKAAGVIIVRNGNFEFNNSSNGFEGVIIVIGNGNLKADGSCDTNSGKGYYTQPGGVQLDGYVAASGCIEIKGNVSPSTTIDYTNLNSFYDVKLWSWRELYQ